MTVYRGIHIALMVLLSPLMLGVINRTKAVMAGRKGQPLFQAYYDIWKLTHKGAVISRSTSWLFIAGPSFGLAATLAAALLMPCGSVPALLSFPGDLIAFAYLFGLARFFTILAAMDTGSAFEGMGASREATFSAMAEPALLISLAALAREAGSYSLTSIYCKSGLSLWAAAGPAIVLATVSLFIVLLAENARIPVDDPATHLELTMIHEVMVLDHGGTDLAMITWGASLKLWLFGSLIVGMIIPAVVSPAMAITLRVAGMLGMAIAIGLTESMMARLRLVRVPQLLTGACALALLALILTFSMR